MIAPAGYMDTHGAAKVLGCTYRTIQNLMKRKAIPYYKMGKRVLFKESDLLLNMERYKVQPAPASTTAVEDCEAWTQVCNGLQKIKNSKDKKHAQLATETLRFIMKFEI